MNRGATGRGPLVLGARDPGGSLGFPWFLLVFIGLPWFSESVVLCNFLGFPWFQSLWFSTSGSLDSSLTVDKDTSYITKTPPTIQRHLLL